MLKNRERRNWAKLYRVFKHLFIYLISLLHDSLGLNNYAVYVCSVIVLHWYLMYQVPIPQKFELIKITSHLVYTFYIIIGALYFCGFLLVSILNTNQSHWTWKFHELSIYVYTFWDPQLYVLLSLLGQEGNANSASKPDFYIFLLIFQHKWMFLSTMQTLPNQIPLGPAEMISLLSFSVEFLFLLNM